MKKFKINFEIWTDDDGREAHYLSNADTNEYLFSASEISATECPEDNYFYRDLFSGDRYLDAVRLGMKLAKEGYADLEVNKINKDF